MPWAMKPSCAPFSGEISGSTAVTIPTPTNETEATASSRSAAPKSACGNSSPKNSATTANSSAVRTTP
jgi:hypothetical protein